MTNKNRLAQLEKAQQANEPNDNKIFVMLFGEDGRVIYGSDELNGMTREQVNAYTGAAHCIHVIPESEDKDGDE